MPGLYVKPERTTIHLSKNGGRSRCKLDISALPPGRKSTTVLDHPDFCKRCKNFADADALRDKRQADAEAGRRVRHELHFGSFKRPV
jgi:hypothetical protein